MSQLVQRLVANQAIDVIQSPEYHAAGLLTALRHRRIPVVVRLSTPAYLCRQTSGVAVGGSRWDTLISERLEYYMARSAAAVTSPSQKLAEDVSRNWHLDVRAVRLVRTPVDDELFSPAEKSTPHNGSLLFAGRLSRIKGVETLVEALPAVLEKFPDLRVRLVGKDHSGPSGSSMSDYLRQRLRQLSVPERVVEFTGPLEWTVYPLSTGMPLCA